MNKVNYSFLVVAKTKESTEGGDFKRYIGVGSSFVLDVNPDKKRLDELMGYDSPNDPEYIGTDDNGKFARVNFIVRTDPAVNNGIEVVNRLSFILRPVPAYNRDKTKVQVIDKYGNTTWASVEDAEAGRKILSSNGNAQKIADQYRIASVGEADLVAFLKAYLNVDDAFNYKNGSWVLKDNAEECVFGLEHFQDYFKGDFSELKEALKLQPNNKVKLLYGVKTTDDGKQYQAIASRGEFILRNSANSNALSRLAKSLLNAKQAGSYATTEFKVQELQEYSVEPTNLDTPQNTATGSEDAMPWD